MSGLRRCGMPGVTPASLHILVLTPDAERLRGALVLALSAQALGQNVGLFLQLDAVRLLTTQEAPADAAHIAAGLPRLAALIDEALESGIAITACQTGLHLAGLTAEALDPRIATGGPMGFLGAIQPADRLITI